MALKSDSNLTLKTTGKLVTLTLTGMAARPINISGIFDVKILSSLTGTYANLDGLTVRATDGIGNVNVRFIANSIFSAGTMGNITTSKDVSGSIILGPDDQWGTGDDVSVVPTLEGQRLASSPGRLTSARRTRRARRPRRPGSSPYSGVNCIGALHFW